MSRARSTLGLLGVALALTACHVPGFAAPTPADHQGAQAASLWRVASFVALGVGCLVWGLIVYVIVRYRRRASSVPSQRPQIIWLEIVYTVIPLVIVGVLFVSTTLAQRKMTALSAHPDLRVAATAFQWGWEFTYPGGRSVVTSEAGPPTLVLPEGETTEIDLTATDVVHAFYVPVFLFQRNAVPGSPTSFDVTPTRLGTFDGKCSAFCGIRHYAMTFTVRVVAPDEFRRWVGAR